MTPMEILKRLPAGDRHASEMWMTWKVNMTKTIATETVTLEDGAAVQPGGHLTVLDVNNVFTQSASLNGAFCVKL